MTKLTSKFDIGNYSPIPIFLIFSKIMDKISRVSNTKLSALDDIVHVKVQFESDLKCLIVSLDLRKSFDMVIDHKLSKKNNIKYWYKR